MIDTARTRILTILLILIYTLAILHGSAQYFSLYWIYSWFDILTHFLGGMWVGLAALWFFYCSGYVKTPELNKGVALLVALGSVGVIGLLWEAYEFFSDLYFNVPLSPQYIDDTVLDLIMDELGALVGYAIFSKFIRKKEEVSQTTKIT